MVLLAIGVPRPVLNPQAALAIWRISAGVCFPVSIKSQHLRTRSKRFGSRTTVLRLSPFRWFWYPSGVGPGSQPDSAFARSPRFTFLLRTSTYFWAIPNSRYIQTTLSSDWLYVWNGVMILTPCSFMAQMMAPPSTGLRARRSSFQQRIPSASPRYRRSIRELNTGRPGALVDLASVITAAIFTPFFTAY